MKKLLLLFIGGVLACTPLFAETIVPGGDVYGNWAVSGSPYLIQGTITVPAGLSLTIEPGVTVAFQVDSVMFVRGTLNATGNPADSIYFHAYQTGGHWGGIRFINAPDFSHLTYCVITDAHGFDCWNKGGALFLDHSNPVVTHSTIRGNESPYIGGAIACLYANPTISFCEISSNHADSDGGALFLDNSSPQITNCIISDNSSGNNGGALACAHSSNPAIVNCAFERNEADGYGGGILAELSSPLIYNCQVEYNHAGLGGGGLRFTLYANPSLDSTTVRSNTTAGYGAGISLENYANSNIAYCLITNNTASGPGGGIDCGSYCLPSIDHCTIRANAGGQGAGINCGQWGPSISNNIIENNTGGGINFMAGQTYGQIKYNDVYNNQGGNYTGGSIPLFLGQNTLINANSDSCDQFYNISFNPMFVNPTVGNLDLLWGSPCIDAGNPSAPHDPDGTVTDMGALPFDQTTLPAQPEIGVSSLVLSYGLVWIQSPSAKPLKIYNTGDTTLVIYQMQSSNNAIFSVNWNIADSLVLPGDSLTVQVVFHPPEAQFYSENLTINDNDVQVNIALLGTGSVTGVIENGQVPQTFALDGPYPNPFNPNTTFTLSLPKAVDVSLSVYDVSGRLLKTLLSGRRDAGVYQIGFGDLTLPSGVYLYRLQAGEYNANGKMVLLK